MEKLPLTSTTHCHPSQVIFNDYTGPILQCCSRIKTAIHLVMMITLAVILPAPNIQHSNILTHPVTITAKVAVTHTIPTITVKNTTTVVEVLAGRAISTTHLIPAPTMMKKAIPYLTDAHLAWMQTNVIATILLKIWMLMPSKVDDYIADQAASTLPERDGPIEQMTVITIMTQLVHLPCPSEKQDRLPPQAVQNQRGRKPLPLLTKGMPLLSLNSYFPHWSTS